MDAGRKICGWFRSLGAVNLNTNIQNGNIKKYREKAGKDAAERFAVSFFELSLS